MDINELTILKRKYNRYHVENVVNWNNIANKNIEELRELIYTPYKYTKIFEPAIISFLYKFRPVDKVLDYGCGIGRNFSLLKQYSKVVHGYDFQSMTNSCREYCKDKIDLLTSDISIIQNNKYDIVFDIQTLQFFADYNAIYEYLYMVSKISKSFYLIARSYIESPSKDNILQTINDTRLFKPLRSTVNLKQFLESSPNEQLHAEILFTPKETKIFPITLKSDVPVCINDDERTDIALLDNAYDTYKGGQYYNLLISLVLQQFGYQVTHYSSNYQKMWLNFYEYKRPKFKIADIDNLDIPFCDAYFGFHAGGAIRAIELGKKYNRPIFIFLYDCPSCYKTFKEVDNHFITYENNAYTNIKEKSKGVANINFIVLTEEQKEHWSKWMESPEERFHVITPFINSKVLRSINVINKEKQIVAISRYGWNKNWEETLEIFRHFQRDYKLHIITDHPEHIIKHVDNADVCGDRVIFHSGISDVEKFCIIKKSQLLISNSIYEGFGMWAIEGLACGTPVVCYDLPSLKSIEHPGIFKVKNKKEFLKTCKKIIKSPVSYNPVMEYDFDNNIDNVVNLIKPKLTTNIKSYEKINKKYYEISTTYDTKPFVFHFTSIYNKMTSIHYATTRECWNKIINSIYNHKEKIEVSKDILIFTYNNLPTKSILEICCEILNIPLIVLGKDIKKWHHNDRLKYIIDFLEDKTNKYFLHIDALDAVIFGNINQILDDKIDDSVLFNAQTVCHPASPVMEQAIEEIAPENTMFKHVNGGVFFGTKKAIVDLFKIALETQKYPSTQPICDDCDQGKFVTILSQQKQLLKLDYFCKHFFCTDANIRAEKFLNFREQ